MSALASLFVRLGIKGVDEVKSGLAATNAAVQRTATESGKAHAGFSSFKNPLVEAAFAASSVAQGVGTIFRGLDAVTGVSYAATFQQMEVGFTTLLGDAKKAHEMVENLRILGGKTQFDTQGLGTLAMRLQAAGIPAGNLLDTVQAIADATAALGGGNEKADGIALALGQIRQSKHLMGQDLNQLIQRSVPLQRVAEAGSGKKFKDTGDAVSYMKKLTGQEAFDLIVKGMEKAFPKAAEHMGMDTLPGIQQNLKEAFQNITLPIGNQLLPILIFGGKELISFANQIKYVSEVSKGGAGLTLLATGLVRTLPLIAVSGRAAHNKLKEIVADLYLLAGVPLPRGGAGVPGVVPTVGVGGAGWKSLKFNPLSKDGWKSLGPNLKALGVGGKLRGVGGFLLPTAVSIGTGMVGDKIGGARGDYLKNIGTGVGFGLMIPGLWGKVIGAVGGAIIGAGYTKYNSGKGNGSAADSTQQQIAKNTAAAAKHMEEIKGNLIGGGARARRAVGVLEVEHALAHALGGVG